VTKGYIAATQASYDAVAAAYADQLSDELRRKPLDRARHPDLEFSAGSMTALPAPDGYWAGLVCFYALIHMIEDADVRAALAEFRRVLADGGLLLLAVHAGEEVRHSQEWFGAPVDVSFRFFDPGWLSAELDRAGLTVEALTRRQPYPDAEVATERAHFLARARSGR
jgi:SAM-dependent methyltransferase